MFSSSETESRPEYEQLGNGTNASDTFDAGDDDEENSEDPGLIDAMLKRSAIAKRSSSRNAKEERLVSKSGRSGRFGSISAFTGFGGGQGELDHRMFLNLYPAVH